jgi:hypothetical protein
VIRRFRLHERELSSNRYALSLSKSAPRSFALMTPQAQAEKEREEKRRNLREQMKSEMMAVISLLASIVVDVHFTSWLCRLICFLEERVLATHAQQWDGTFSGLKRSLEQLQRLFANADEVVVLEKRKGVLEEALSAGAQDVAMYLMEQILLQIVRDRESAASVYSAASPTGGEAGTSPFPHATFPAAAADARSFSSARPRAEARG